MDSTHLSYCLATRRPSTWLQRNLDTRPSRYTLPECELLLLSGIVAFAIRM